MIKAYARKICHAVAAVAFLVLLGIVGGIEKGTSLSEARPLTIAILIITILATFAGDLLGEETQP